MGPMFGKARYSRFTAGLDLKNLIIKLIFRVGH